MAFYEAYETLKKAAKNLKATGLDEHLAVELVITDEEHAGIAYLEASSGTVRLEPYDYFNHDARLIGRCQDLAAVLSGKLDFDKAIAEEKLFVEGDLDRAVLVKKLIRKPAGRKSAASKTAAEKAEATIEKAPPAKRTKKKTEQ